MTHGLQQRIGSHDPRGKCTIIPKYNESTVGADASVEAVPKAMQKLLDLAIKFILVQKVVNGRC